MNHSNTFLKMSCVKYLLVLLNVFFLLISLFMIIFGTSGLVFSEHYSGYISIMETFNAIFIVWIAAGLFLGCVSIFALIGSFKESVIGVNLYAVLMMLSFFLQISMTIIAFSLIGKSKEYASHLIISMMDNYEYDASPELNWIQNNFECCGLEGPNDWYYNRAFYPNDGGNRWYPYASPIASYPTEEKYRTPSSCCTKESGYKNFTCENYYEIGCGEHMRAIISSNIMIMGSVAFTISIVQVLGIVIAFMLARVLRRTKSYRHVLKTETLSQRVSETPTHIDYNRLYNNNE